MKMESLHSASLEDFQACVVIVFSAVTYLFDFSSNIATLIEYHHMAEEHHYWKRFFLALLAIMTFAHIANAVVFKFELKKEDQPLKAAYLLPLMQLRRLVQALWRTCSCKGLGNLKAAADDKRTLYNILSVSLETAPQLILQFWAFLVYYTKTRGPPPKTLLISIFASFLSGTVNGGLAILAVSRIQTQDISWRVKMVGFIIAGLFTFSALLLQCITVIELGLFGWNNNNYPYHVYEIMVISFHMIVFMVLLRRKPSASKYALRSYCNGRRFLHCAALSYVAANTGSLQPVTSDAKLKDELGKPVYWYRLLLTSTVQLCLHGGVFLLCLVGPSHWRWSTLCPKHFHRMYQDELKGFPCGWHAPVTISGMLLYSITISSHILMDSHVNRSCLRIYPATNKSMQKELSETDAAHKVYDVDEEQEDWDAGKHGQEVQIACEVPRGTLKKIQSHGQGEISYIDTTREVESSHGQAELTYDTTRDELLQRSHANQVKISCETTREYVCNHETMEYTTTQITCKEPSKLGFPTENMMRFQEDEQSLQNGEEGMVEMEAGECGLLATKDVSMSATLVLTLMKFDVPPIPSGHF